MLLKLDRVSSGGRLCDRSYQGYLYQDTEFRDGFKGLLKKIVMFIVIVVAYTIQKLLNDTIALRDRDYVFYICNEALSLLENAAMFIPIPDKLKDVLLQLRDKEVEDNGK